MAIMWEDIFDNFGIKRVSKTDKKKSAYVLNQPQKIAMDAAGRKAEARGPAFKITILFDPNTNSVSASRYDSERSVEANREPEPRVGREFISTWLETGDHVVIGNIGKDVFAAKIRPESCSKNANIITTEFKDDADKIIDALANSLSLDAIYQKARAASKKQRSRTKTVTKIEYVRNDLISIAALSRSQWKCEMPKFSNSLFMRDNGNPYLEVHHIIPLSEDGPDSIENTAALCPHCHRNLHSGKDRKTLRSILTKQINNKMKP